MRWNPHPVTPITDTAVAPPTNGSPFVVPTRRPSPADNRDNAMHQHTCTCCQELAELRTNVRGLAAALVIAVEDHDPPVQES